MEDCIVEATRIWDRALLVLDTNLLLSVLRFSDEGRAAMVALLDGRGDRFWVPAQVAREFEDNAPRQKAKLKEMPSKFQIIFRNRRDQTLKTLDSLSSYDLYPGINATALAEMFSSAFVPLFRSLDEAESEFSPMVDDLVNRAVKELNELMRDRTQEKLSEDEVALLEEEAARRAEMRIPPGWKDKGKTGGPRGHHAAGDYKIWKAIMDESRRLAAPVIFVTNDVKPDWWEIGPNGVPIRPQPALLKEFAEETNQEIVILRTEGLLEVADRAGHPVAPSALPGITEALRIEYENYADSDVLTMQLVDTAQRLLEDVEEESELRRKVVGERDAAVSRDTYDDNAIEAIRMGMESERFIAIRNIERRLSNLSGAVEILRVRLEDDARWRFTDLPRDSDDD